MPEADMDNVTLVGARMRPLLPHVPGTIFTPCKECGLPTALAPAGQAFQRRGAGVICDLCYWETAASDAEPVIDETIRAEVEAFFQRPVPMEELRQLVNRERDRRWGG